MAVNYKAKRQNLHTKKYFSHWHILCKDYYQMYHNQNLKCILATIKKMIQKIMYSFTIK